MLLLPPVCPYRQTIIHWDNFDGTASPDCWKKDSSSQVTSVQRQSGVNTGHINCGESRVLKRQSHWADPDAESIKHLLQAPQTISGQDDCLFKEEWKGEQDRSINLSALWGSYQFGLINPPHPSCTIKKPSSDPRHPLCSTWNSTCMKQRCQRKEMCTGQELFKSNLLGVSKGSNCCSMLFTSWNVLGKDLLFPSSTTNKSRSTSCEQRIDRYRAAFSPALTPCFLCFPVSEAFLVMYLYKYVPQLHMIKGREGHFYIIIHNKYKTIYIFRLWVSRLSGMF